VTFPGNMCIYLPLLSAWYIFLFWAFCVYLEAVSVLPQLRVMQWLRYKETKQFSFLLKRVKMENPISMLLSSHFGENLKMCGPHTFLFSLLNFPAVPNWRNALSLFYFSLNCFSRTNFSSSKQTINNCYTRNILK